MADGKYKKSKVGVLYGGTSPEREISLRTGKAVLAALRAKGYDAHAIDVGPDLARQLLDQKIQVAFVALHGKLGEDGSVQGLLEVMRIPYTHSGVLASAIAMDKISTKRVYEHAGLPTPSWSIFQHSGKALTAVDDLPGKVPFPLVVKPANAGSTIGLTIVKKNDRNELATALNNAAEYDRAILVEQFVAGTEITVAVITEAGQPSRAFPVIEIVPPEGMIFDFDAKYTYAKGKTQYLIPARLDPKVAEEASRIAVAAHDVLGCEGVTRSDLIVDAAGKPWLLETNTIPGMTETSLVPKAARAVGIEFPELVDKILESARLKL